MTSLSKLLPLLFLLAGSTFAGICKLPAKLADLGVLVSTQKQTDYGRINLSARCYFEAYPQTTAMVAKLVSAAYAAHIPIRTQGAAHSLNGSALPQEMELIIHTTNLNQVYFNQVGRVIADSGIPIALLKQITTQQSSFVPPIVNYGPVAPTIGGYIAAGGLSPEAQNFGGFWEHVKTITLVTGFGNVLTIKRQDPLFAYLFGAMGQLGIITEVELMLLPDRKRPFRYPYGLTFRTHYQPTDGHYWLAHQEPKASYWLNLLVPSNQVMAATQDLVALEQKHATNLSYDDIYQWQIRFIHIMPPLVYSKAQTFYLIGIWVTRTPNAAGLKALAELTQSYADLVYKQHYQRYIQAENQAGPTLYREYFNPATYARFKALKQQLYPEFLFNRQSVFN
jgi:FAD/FMN-containing dehydrogenase